MSTLASEAKAFSLDRAAPGNHDSAHEPISRFGIPDESSLPPHVADIYAKFRRQYGFVPNWLAALSVNPDTAYRLVVFYEHLFDPQRSHLTAAERELIAVVTSAANQCSYCVFNHTQALAAAIGDTVRAQRIAQGFHHVRLTARESALAELAERLTREPTTIDEAELQRLRQAGFTREAVTEALEISAFFSYANRLTIALNVVPDDQFFAGRDLH
ncbi:putative peroxidase-related enzyme (plasmid) [Paraburkholderia caribensis MBA4]|uniref:Putative peroxidase-related enzyme n=1 Tax=Paraburkholderia caribensis MBA4 TaxID=1323664 RepID=A0A0P0RN30_9BURK|nr:peroxidase-related enzyme [Paraburkholderia caribensis]ALL70264.1 putative peroxidase-related enzyme [Paraburkholderia caribensis MBA4]